MSDSTQPVGPPRPQPPAPTATSTARLALPTAEFTLAPLFERVPDARVTLEPAVANPNDHALVVIRGEGLDHCAVERALEADQTVAGVETFGGHESGWRYRVTWTGRARRLVQHLIGEGLTVLNARGRSGRWKLRLLSPDRESLAEAYEMLEDLGHEPDCLSVTTLDSGQMGLRELTDEQHETLVTAFEMGYYDIPRNATSTELADHLGISHQALSERFRRAHKRLVESELIVE